MRKMHRILTLFLFAALLSTPAFATVWGVAVHNFAFTPPDLTISRGDTVIWTNVEGFHNVHHTGTPSLFGNTAASAPWIYMFVFDLPPATYDYICEVHPSQMQGSITVLPQAADEVPPPLASKLELSQNYPNPFNSQTTIEFNLPTSSQVRLDVLNVLGQVVGRVYSGNLAAGSHRVTYDASGLSTGVYYYRLTTPIASAVRTMQYIR